MRTRPPCIIKECEDRSGSREQHVCISQTQLVNTRISTARSPEGDEGVPWCDEKKGEAAFASCKSHVDALCAGYGE